MLGSSRALELVPVLEMLLKKYQNMTAAELETSY